VRGKTEAELNQLKKGNRTFSSIDKMLRPPNLSQVIENFFGRVRGLSLASLYMRRFNSGSYYVNRRRKEKR